MNFFADKDMTIPAFPRTKVKAISDDDGVGLDALLNDLNSKIENNDVIADLQSKVGDTSVSDQINNALDNFVFGKTLTEHLTEESMVLSSLQYGNTLPEPGAPGRIFFLKVSE